jgi:uncharacterized phage protein (TIGR02220 family)
MAVTIQDDMFEAAGYLPAEQRTEFLAALLTYGQYGDEPSKDEPWYGMFVMAKFRLDKSRDMHDARAEAGRRSGERRRKASAHAAKNGAEVCSEQNANTVQVCSKQNANTVAAPVPNVEEEEEEEEEEENPQTPLQGARAEDSGRMDEVREVIDHLNAVTGKRYTASKGNARYVRARLNDGHTVAELNRAVDNMAAEWLHDPRMQRFLRPDTLFRPEKFEGYLNARPAGRASPVVDLTAYDGGTWGDGGYGDIGVV